MRIMYAGQICPPPRERGSSVKGVSAQRQIGFENDGGSGGGSSEESRDGPGEEETERDKEEERE